MIWQSQSHVLVKDVRQSGSQKIMKFSRIPIRFSRRVLTVAAGIGAASALAMGAAGAATSSPEVHASGSISSRPFVFPLVPPAAIHACLPHLGGTVAIFPHKLNDTMVVSIHGAPANTDFDLFVTQTPTPPNVGLSWYQTDVDAGRNGTGMATVQGIFDSETFSAVPDASAPLKFDAVHQFHLGLWFNDPNVPFQLHCEPGKTAAVVTVFNGEQHAGVQALNTSNFPDNAGPLSHVHR
jgi:hypothetical protein